MAKPEVRQMAAPSPFTFHVTSCTTIDPSNAVFSYHSYHELFHQGGYYATSILLCIHDICLHLDASIDVDQYLAGLHKHPLEPPAYLGGHGTTCVQRMKLGETR